MGGGGDTGTEAAQSTFPRQAETLDVDDESKSLCG